MASREFQTLNKQPKKGEQMNNKASIQSRVDCLNKAEAQVGVQVLEDVK